MSDYTETLTITVPLALLEVSKRISRALDPDVGGYEAFKTLLPSSTNPTRATYSTPCVPEFKASAVYMTTHPEALFEAVQQDYAARWPALAVPTLKECQQFCQGAEIA